MLRHEVAHCGTVAARDLFMSTLLPTLPSASTRLPNFVVLGQGKAGTSLIYRVLSENPNIGLSSKKELHFFNRQENFEKGMDYYASFFSHIEQNIKQVGEISPSYLRAGSVRRIAEELGSDTKVIFILRRPIEQAYSRYLQNTCSSRKAPSFHEVIHDFEYRTSNAIKAIRECYKLFGSDNVLPMFFERDIAVENPEFERKILNFIGVPGPETYGMFADKPVNPGIMPRYIFSGDRRLVIQADGIEYSIPEKCLVFCAQPRNSVTYMNPSAEDIQLAFAAQSQWSAEVTAREYAVLQDRWVIPFAEQLEKEFGFDMTHWRNPPRQIIYSPAPLPHRHSLTR